ncbi:MAG: hypothetical protein NTX73_03900 [Rhodobacterales bacterium]|nr:hypothetical protein [Rhodobacterales bacterium]
MTRVTLLASGHPALAVDRFAGQTFGVGREKTDVSSGAGIQTTQFKFGLVASRALLDSNAESQETGT